MRTPAVLSVAGQRIGFTGPAALLGAVEGYRSFASRGKPQALFVCAAGSARNRAGTSFRKGVFTVSDGMSVAALDTVTGQGVFTFRPASLPVSLATLLRVMSGFLFVRSGAGVLLHAAAVADRDKAYVFAGPSGAGKSTVCRLSEDKAVISDETVFLASGAKGYRVAPVPAWGDYRRFEPRRPVCVAGIYRLVKDTRVGVCRLAPAMAAAELLSVPHALNGCVSPSSLLSSFGRLCAAVPCFDLHFRKDASFWEHISWN